MKVDVDVMTAFEDKTTENWTLPCEADAATDISSCPERYVYRRVGSGGREWFPLDFWVERAGEFYGKPNFTTGDFHWSHSTQIFYHTAGEAVLDYGRQAVPLSPGNIFIVPPGRRFTYRGKEVRFQWVALAGQWPRVLGDEHRMRRLAMEEDADIQSKFTEIREVLVSRRGGYPLKAAGIFFELVARIEELNAGSTLAQSTYPEVVCKAMTYLTENYARPFVAAETARAVNISQSHLRALFEKWLGESPRRFHTRQRINQAARLLRKQQFSISEVASEVGYDDARYFSRVFKRINGVSPSQYIAPR